LSGCDSARALRARAVAQSPADTRTIPDAAAPRSEPAHEAGTEGQPDQEQRYREAIVKTVVNNPRIARLIPHKPLMGGTWRVGEREDIHFLGGGLVAIDYEDGHVAGRLLVQVKDPHDLKSWKVLEDKPE
jgi:hypothetical protein